MLECRAKCLTYMWLMFEMLQRLILKVSYFITVEVSLKLIMFDSEFFCLFNQILV